MRPAPLVPPLSGRSAQGALRRGARRAGAAHTWAQYWKQPEYACFISHTFCLHTLDLLRDRNFRTALLQGKTLNELVGKIDEQQNLSFFAGQLTEEEFQARFEAAST